jgi:effector-binding domain-containing protein
MQTEAAPRYRISAQEVLDELIASVTSESTLTTVGDVIQVAFGTLGRAIGEAEAFGDGPPGLIVHEMGDTGMTLEIFMPVARAFEAPPGVTIRTLVGGRVATTVHEGPYEEIGPAYQAVTAWIADHREVSTGPPRERYLNDPHAFGEKAARTRVEFPIA